MKTFWKSDNIWLPFDNINHIELHRKYAEALDHIDVILKTAEKRYVDTKGCNYTTEWIWIGIITIPKESCKKFLKEYEGYLNSKIEQESSFEFKDYKVSIIEEDYI